MAKPNPLAQGLNQISARTAAPVSVASSAAQPQGSARSKVPPSRGGRVLVGGFFTPEVHLKARMVEEEQL